MFDNLKAEMARKGITMKDISRDLSYVYETLRNKFNGTTEWSRSEMFYIKNQYFPDKSVEYLFKQKSTTSQRKYSK